MLSVMICQFLCTGLTTEIAHGLLLHCCVVVMTTAGLLLATTHPGQAVLDRWYYLVRRTHHVGNAQFTPDAGFDDKRT